MHSMALKDMSGLQADSGSHTELQAVETRSGELWGSLACSHACPGRA